MPLCLCHFILLCECKQLTHHHQVEFTLGQLPALIPDPLIVVYGEESAAWFAVKMLAPTALLGKACDAPLLYLSTVTHINGNVIVVEREITKRIIEDIVV